MFEDCYLRFGTGPVKGCLPLTAELLSSLYALPHHTEADLAAVLDRASGDWPWSASLSVAPRETAQVVGEALRAVMLAAPGDSPDGTDINALADGSRARIHLEALLRLWREQRAAMPADIATLHTFLACEADDVLQKVALIAPPHDPARSQLEQSVINLLAQQHVVCGQDDPDFIRLVGERCAPAAAVDTLLGHIQRGLLSPSATTIRPDDSFAVLTVRDSLGECEAAVTIIQRWLRQDDMLAPADIAVIVPNDGAHAAQLRSLADDAGLLLQGLPASASARNIGAETVYLFLCCQRDPVPQMARASLLASPILPWPADLGRRMARRVMQGRGYWAAGLDVDTKGTELVRLLTSPGASTNKQLCGRLNALRKLLGSSDSRTERDIGEAKSHISLLLNSLSNADMDAAPNWESILKMASSYRLERAPRGSLYPNAISVLHASEMPRRRFSKMIVTGFNEGAYPVPSPRNPIFLDSELNAIEKLCGLTMPTRRGRLDKGLARFARQLGAVRDEVVMLCAERDGYGKALLPASSLALIARLVDGVKDPEDFLASLGAGKALVWEQLIDWVEPVERKMVVRVDPPFNYELGRNLLHLRINEEGKPRPQSPSRLEKLLVSPLAWALGELDAEHVGWAPEALDVRLRGTLAHGVFERLFKAGEPICDPGEVAGLVPTLFDECVSLDAPFMAGTAWAMEREAIIGDIVRSAQSWATTLRNWGATVVANEFWLEGEIMGHPVHGMADSLLQLGNGLPVIVDHKKSSSGKRRRRMEAGCDLQVELYRQMRVKITLSENEEPGPASTVLAEAGGKVGVAYNMMNDAGVLVNGIDGHGSTGVEVFDTEISHRAMKELERRFEALRLGQLHTNASGDEKHFDKVTALGTYAFDDSPLIRAFMRNDSAPSAFAMENEDD